MFQAKFSRKLRSRPEWHALGPALFASKADGFQGINVRHNP
jgi:hypothetical protein